MGAGTGIGQTYTTYKERATAPATPAATYDRLYFTSAGLYYINSAGEATPVKAGFAVDYAADAGSNDTYVITLSPAPAAYAAGMSINFKANTANTGAATLNVNGLGAKNILKNHDQTLAAGDIEANQIVTVVYDGTQFQMQSQTGTAVETADSPTFGTVTTTGGIELGNASDTTIVRVSSGLASIESKTILLEGNAIGGTTAGTVRSLFDEDAAITTGALSANQCSGGLISNYNQSDDTTMTVPTAFAGGNFIVALSTAVAKYYRLDPTGSEVWVWDGVAQAAGKYIGVAAATVGAALQFISIQTGASAWTWHVYTVAGAWAVEG